jgi:hypothetical protein
MGAFAMLRAGIWEIRMRGRFCADGAAMELEPAQEAADSYFLPW